MSDLFRALLLLPPAASTVADDVDVLHFVVIGTSIVGSLGVAAIAALLVARHRLQGEPVRRGPTPQARLRPRVEWLVAGGLAALFFSWWVVGVIQYGRMRRAPEDAMRVYVVAKQWMFEFGYAGGQATTGELVVPAGRPVELVMTSRDVIHGFYVPAFRLKQDIVPGRTTTLWFEAPDAGHYEILCAEYCGTRHASMRGEVVVLGAAEYEAWLEEHPAPALAERGLHVAATHGCLRCHTTDGSPHIGPSFAGLLDAERLLADGRRVVADEAYLTASMMDPLAARVAGYAPVMPSYQGVLQPEETAALVQLIASLRARPRWDPPDVAPPPVLDRPLLPPPEAAGLPTYPSPPPEPAP